MRTTALVLLCLLLASGFVNVGAILDRKNALQERDAAKAAEEIALARYAEAATQAEATSDTVIREVTKTRTLRDSIFLRIADTAYIQKFVYQTDTLLVSCERCAAQLRSFRVVSDSLLRAKDLRIASLQPSRWEKVKPLAYAGVAFWLGTKFQR